MFIAFALGVTITTKILRIILLKYPLDLVATCIYIGILSNAVTVVYTATFL